MPQELLRQLRPSVGPRRHWSVLPLSVVGHGAAVLAVLIIPLAAEVVPPVPAPLNRTVRLIHLPRETAPPQVRTSRIVKPATPATYKAPIAAPSHIVPERSVPEAAITAPPGSTVDPGAGVGAGVPEGIGSVAPAAVLAAPPPGPVRIGGLIREPKKIVDVRPVYPPMARAARIQGTVILEAIIDEQGNVDQLRVLQSYPFLDAAAMDAVSRWRYTPTQLNGVPVPVLMTITITFRLQD
jgi:protein TonB